MRQILSRVQRSRPIRAASLGSLVEDHDAFLQLVSNHGSGEVRQDMYCDGRVVEMVLSNPSKRNAISGRMMKQLATAIDRITTDKELLCVVLSGCDSAGPAFCAGLDFSLAKDVINTPDRGGAMCDFMTDALTRLRKSDKISVAFIHGPALGGGAEVATSCDFRLMSVAASTAIGFVHAKVGASPGWGGARRLVSIVGRSQAIRLLGTSLLSTPDRCLAIGLADALVLARDENSTPDERPWVPMLAPYLKQEYPDSIKTMKGLVAGIVDYDDAVAASLERNAFISRWGSNDNLSAFKDK